MANTVKTFQDKKAAGERISMLTAYDYPTAKLVSDAGVDSILVGDSLGCAVLGYENTIAVTMEDMIHHGKAVVRGSKNAFVIVDMPFMSYQTSTYDALVNAGRIMKETGCGAVKLEGGVEMAPTIKAIVDAGIPVCAHIGLTPQSVNVFGGNRVQGKDAAAAFKLIEDLKAVEAAGAFAVVLECIPPSLGRIATEQATNIVTIGIGAGPDCDGQVLVWSDMAGQLAGKKPKMVKEYAQINEVLTAAFAQYHEEVVAGTFPNADQSYSDNPDAIKALEEALAGDE